MNWGGMNQLSGFTVKRFYATENDPKIAKEIARILFGKKEVPVNETVTVIKHRTGCSR